MEVMGKRGVKEGREPILGLVGVGRERRGGAHGCCSLFIVSVTMRGGRWPSVGLKRFGP